MSDDKPTARLRWLIERPENVTFWGTKYTITPRLIAHKFGDGKQLVEGIRGALSGLDALKKSGLTGEALVVLVTEKCAWAKNGKRVSAETVQFVLEALFRLGEYVRP